MKKKVYHMPIVIHVTALLAITMLGGCAAQSQPKETEESAPTIEFVSPSEPTAVPEPEKSAEPTETPKPEPEDKPATERQDGERFEETIILEGMEEVVKYEHVKNETLGIEMDYDYDSFMRQKGSDSERFISTYDDPEDPWNYLEVSYVSESVDQIEKTINIELSEKYEVIIENRTLDKASSCVVIDASADKGGKTMPDRLQAVYIIPAGSGSIVARAHFAAEAAEGFGRRFGYMMDTLSVIRR